MIGHHPSSSSQKYLVSTLVLTMEMIKVSLITALIVVTEGNFSVKEAVKLLHKEIVCRPLEALPLAVPSFLYVVQDNLIIYALSCVDATTYQVIISIRTEMINISLMGQTAKVLSYRNQLTNR
jgi:UDP-sugar transporter A1/2/3